MPEETDSTGSDDTGSGGPRRWVQRRRRRPLVRRAVGHIETRLAFSVLTLSTMGFSAAVILAATAVAGLFVNLAQGEVIRAIAFFIVSLMLAVLAGGFGFSMGFIGLPFVGEWFLEWQNHAMGWGIGAGGCAFLAVLLFLTPLPAYGSVLLVLAVVLGGSYLLAYALRVTPPVTPSAPYTRRKR
ncbi:MAG: hypothetical protein QME71_00770 [Dehalococcoidia bacterium]|nr:hypothetical protein [Dehalococcoidia bacterium]